MDHAPGPIIASVAPKVALTRFSSFIYAFACLTVAVLFYAFHRAQS